ncbi:YhdP family protein [Halomonas beimenensis]|uniref:Putative exported protein n=1 Tax=Halomonas beimenensis TaxID=475662 RepID=A0A291P5K9_9GAMM|nr:AsmA-like C-terminal region-containing protein [Halomonas beimenensis]ATJ82149.1 putative exported protein [Halomonas beimenensis]
MAPTRLVIRWTLTLLAAALTLAALLTIVLRLALGQADLLAPRLEALLSARFEAAVTLEGLDGGLEGPDPRLALRGLEVRSRPDRGDRPLLELDAARLRLDAPASLREGMPVVADARLSGLTLHLYQADDGRWHWPEPADIPPELIPEREFDLARLDFWVGVLLRQRAWAEDLRVVLHGRHREAVLEAPRLLMVGDARRVHLEGEVFLEGRPAHQALRVVMEVVPGAGGLEDFGAALQADMNLASLAGLSSLLGVEALPRLDDAEGEARLWARWTHGRLADVRLDLGAPRLAMRQADSPGGSGEGAGIVLEGAALRGQWRRESAEEAWQAWIQGDVRRVSGLDPMGSGPPLPRNWHLRELDDGWWLNTSGFDLAALAAWRPRLPLPEALDEALASLSPRGRVTALGVGRREGQWQARVSATRVAVDPWRHAPGGGPLDLWVTAEGRRGQVRFVDAGEATLAFPRIFGEPLALERASGVVNWVYAGSRTRVNGRDLQVGWRGADVHGCFGLSLGGPGRGGFGLALDLHDVDAVSRPLTDWLPMPLLEERTPALADWLGGGLAGRVPEGSLRLHLPLRRRDGPLEPIEPRLALDLAVEDGRLPFAPGWPALEGVAGRLRLAEGRLSAEVNRAESLGIRAREGRVRLIDGRLTVEAPLVAEADALARYLAAMPVEGADVAADWRGEGTLAAELGLDLTLEALDSLALDIDGDASLARLVHDPSGLAFSDLSGPVAWRQRGEAGVLEGELDGRLLGGPFSADLDSEDERLAFSGTATAEALGTLGAPAGIERILSGRIPWRGRLNLGGEAPTLTLESDLRGLAIELPAPLGKAAAASRGLRLETTLGASSRLSGALGERLGWRWRPEGGGQGQVWLGRQAPATWPAAPGWSLQAYLPRMAPRDWATALAPLAAARGGEGGPAKVARLTLDTDCLSVEGRCLGSLIVEGETVPGGWSLALDGSLMAGRLDYRKGLDRPLDLALSRLRLDGLVPPDGSGGGRLLEEVAVPPDPVAIPSGLVALPAGRLRVDELAFRGRRLGPLTAYWRAAPERLVIDPLGLTLGEISARGSLTWEATGPEASLTRARLDLDGRDLGTALAALGQPVAIRSAETRVDSQLAWPGAPWQFALSRSRGSVEVALRDGRFVNLESPSARVVGLLNVDNLLRRLTLDFSDVTGRGTAFDRVTGAATLYGGVLETRGPVEIEGPATRFTLDGSVDLVRRELDQRLGVTLPVSNNLPLAAVIAGAPVVGGALFIADKLFGDALDRVTRIHYRVEGPWTSPRIALESAE